MDTQDEIVLGRQIASSIERQLPLSRNPYAIERVQLIGSRLVAVADRRDIPYRFRVIERKEVNAMSTPGGNVYVFSGLLRFANDDELAAVIAHEIGHIAARHAVTQMQTQMGYNFLMSLVGSQIGSPKALQAADAVFGLIQLGYSRQDELEADALAVRHMARAGFNPWGLVTFLEKLRAKEGEGVALLQSHPLYSDRIDQARLEISRLGRPSYPSR